MRALKGGLTMFRFGTKAGLMAIFVALTLMGFVFEARGFDAQTSDENRVRVDVKPITLAAGRPAVFEVRLNTHSVELDYDLTKLCLLRDNEGKTYKALNWKGSPPGGHHRKGVLEFPELQGTLQSIKLIIKDIAGVSERSFEWEIKG